MRAAPRSQPAPVPDETGFVVRVVNDYKLDVTVHLIHDGQHSNIAAY